MTGVTPCVVPDILAQHIQDARFITPPITQPDCHETIAETLRKAFSGVHKAITLHDNLTDAPPTPVESRLSLSARLCQANLCFANTELPHAVSLSWFFVSPPPWVFEDGE